MDIVITILVTGLLFGLMFGRLVTEDNRKTPRARGTKDACGSSLLPSS
jgi:hypothetical protein